MKVSVITVSFNSDKTIEQTIKSVINQKYKNLEFIVIDGESNDETKKIINKYIHNINIFKSEKDKGIYDAINKGINCASGDLICLLHSDDIFYDSDVLSNVVSYFENNDDLEILLGASIFKKELNKKNVLRHYPAKGFKPWMLRFGYSPPHVSSFIKKNVYKKYGLYDHKFKIAGDFDFFAKCFFYNKINFHTVKDIYVIMRPGGESGKNLKSFYLSTKEILQSLNNQKIYSNIFFILMRFPIKLTQFIFKK